MVKIGSGQNGFFIKGEEITMDAFELTKNGNSHKHPTALPYSGSPRLTCWPTQREPFDPLNPVKLPRAHGSAAAKAPLREADECAEGEARTPAGVSS